MAERKRVGLALGGGAIRGIAHLGVLKVLEREGVQIDCVAGTSVGSLVGMGFCTGIGVNELVEIARRIGWRHLARPHFGREGIVSFRPIRQLVNQYFDYPAFDDLQIPLTVVTTDVDADHGVNISTGAVGPAIEASCSTSGLVPPVEIDGRRLADGILVNAVPVSVTRKMGADYVIGVDVLRPFIRPHWGAISHAINSVEIVLHHAGGGIKTADCLIAPEVGGATYLRFAKREELIRLGAEAAEVQLPKILHDLSMGT